VTNASYAGINHDQHDNQGGDAASSWSVNVHVATISEIQITALVANCCPSSKMSLSLDVLYMIAELSPLATRAALSQCNSTLHFLYGALLYRQNDRLHSYSIALDILQRSSDTTAALSALCKAHAAGADLDAHRPMRVVDISQHFYVQYVTSPIRTDTIIEMTPLHLAAARGR
jgi:hypothetical protein